MGPGETLQGHEESPSGDPERLHDQDAGKLALCDLSSAGDIGMP